MTNFRAVVRELNEQPSCTIYIVKASNWSNVFTPHLSDTLCKVKSVSFPSHCSHELSHDTLRVGENRNKLSIGPVALYCMLKHDYDVIHCSIRTLFSPNVQINAYRPKCSERIDFWTVSKDIGQLSNTTQTVVFLQNSSVLFFK